MNLRIKCADLNRYTFSSMFSNVKVFLFKSAHFMFMELGLMKIQFSSDFVKPSES